MATDICLPVLKFSYATGVRSDNTIPWTHISAVNVFVVVKGANDGQLTMRVVQGNNVLESVDIGGYIDHAVSTRRKSEQAGITPQVEQLPVFGITKESLLALRYRLNDGQARRLQLRMQSSAECQQVVAVFRYRGMEFQEQRPRTARPGTARLDTAQSRPLTAQSVTSPFFDSSAPVLRPSPFTAPSIEAPIARPSPFTAPAVEAGSLSQAHHPSSPERRSFTSGQPAEVSQHGSQQMLPPQRLFNRDEVTAPREVAPTRPSTAQIYRSYTNPAQPSQSSMPPELHRQPSDPVFERPTSTSNIANLEAIRNAVQQDAASMTGLELPTLPSHANDHYSSATADPLNLALLSSDPTMPRPLTARPSTSATTSMPETLEHEIPPRRELPFSRSSSDKHSSRPGSSTLTLPPLPKPNLGQAGSRPISGSPEKMTLTARPSTASPLKRTLAATEIEEHARLQTAVGITNPGSAQDASPERRLSPVIQTASTTAAVRKPSRMDDLLNSRKPLSERSANTSHKIPRLNSLADAPHETISPPPSPSKAFTTSPTHQPTASTAPTRDPTINAYTACVSSPSKNLDGAEEVSLAAYASQSRADREAALDEFMVSNLENPAFTQLCEDVENCWRRIALGL